MEAEPDVVVRGLHELDREHHPDPADEENDQQVDRHPFAMGRPR